jgi:hypothetical protein
MRAKSLFIGKYAGKSQPGKRIAGSAGRLL